MLVTGAGGFLGRHVVRALVARGHQVRALLRPGASSAGLDLPPDVEVRHADLRSRADLGPALANVEVLVHLAARVSGTDEERFAGTVVSTEHLMAAASGVPLRRVVLASSYVVYDWHRVHGWLTEESPTLGRPYDLDGYAIAKVWQERVVRRACAERGLELAILRPGVIWGPGAGLPGALGLRVPWAQILIGPARRPPLTYVENCADCFALAADHPDAGSVFNVVDGHDKTVWRFAKEYAQRSGDPGQRIPIPYVVGLAAARATSAAGHALLGPHARLPSVVRPRRFEARFKPVRDTAAKARRTLGWQPRIGVAEALDRTFGTR